MVSFGAVRALQRHQAIDGERGNDRKIRSRKQFFMTAS